MNNRITEKLEEFIRREAENLNYTIVEMTAKGSGQGFFLDIIIDRQGGITLGECAGFNKGLMAWIEKNKIFAHGCTIDVSSPGLDREIKTDSAFFWARGKQVKVSLRGAINGKNVFVGTLLEKDNNGDIVLKPYDTDIVRVDSSDVIKIKLNM